LVAVSKFETPMTLNYWARVGGTIVEEFRAVRPSATAAVRFLDAVILPAGERRQAKAFEVEIEGAEIIVVQTKNAPLGMSLLGQAFFSALLMRERFRSASVHSVAICAKDDSVLRPLAERYGIEVVIDDSQRRPRNPRARAGSPGPMSGAEGAHRLRHRSSA
jgi:hypothetical protein